MTDQPGPRTGEMDEWIQLASGIAFDLRNSLMVVHGYTELALEELGPAHPRGQAPRGIEESRRPRLLHSGFAGKVRPR